MKQRAKDLMLSTYEVKVNEYQAQIDALAQDLQEVNSTLDHKRAEVATIDQLLSTKQEALARCTHTLEEKNTLICQKNAEYDQLDSIREKKIEEYKEKELLCKNSMEMREHALIELSKTFDETIKRKRMVDKEILDVQEAINGEKKRLLELHEKTRIAQLDLDTVIESQKDEKSSLIKQREDTERAYKTLKEDEKKLYVLRDDLQIVRDRYANFARENNLPFNV